ncbi:MAG: DUF3017 domain-containing protein [Actinomycetes bacterium]
MRAQLRSQWPLTTVYTGLLVSLAMAVWVDFRIGAVLLSLTVLGAFGLRYFLTDDAAGLLKVRRRRVDLTILALLGTVLLILALVVPHRTM